MPDERTVGFSRILSQMRGLPVGDSPLAVAAKSTRQLRTTDAVPLADGSHQFVHRARAEESVRGVFANPDIAPINRGAGRVPLFQTKPTLR